jgi:hypothetical protein
MQTEQLLAIFESRAASILERALSSLPIRERDEYHRIKNTIKTIQEELLQRGEFGLIPRTDTPPSVVDQYVRQQVQRKLSAISAVTMEMRSDQLAEFLRKNGPSTRQQIYFGTGMPVGTINVLLSSGAFERCGHGIWGVKEPKEEEKKEQEEE